MSNEEFERIRGSGNVFVDLGHPEADLEQFRALLAAKIIKTLHTRKLSVRDADALMDVAHVEFACIRNVRLDRFAAKKLVMILGKLDQEARIALNDPPLLSS